MKKIRGANVIQIIMASSHFEFITHGNEMMKEQLFPVMLAI